MANEKKVKEALKWFNEGNPKYLKCKESVVTNICKEKKCPMYWSKSLCIYFAFQSRIGEYLEVK